jgi:hypothetical protein
MPTSEMMQLQAEGLKRCPPGAGCGDIKPVERFAQNAAKWDGRQIYCKDCDRRRKNRHLDVPRASKPWFQAVEYLIRNHQGEFDDLLANAMVEHDWESTRVVWP